MTAPHDLLSRLRGIGLGRLLELRILVAIVALAGGSWLFLEIVDEVMEGESHALDEQILLMFRDASDPNEPLGPYWVQEMARDVTALGGTSILTFITFAAVFYLLMLRRAGEAGLVLLAIGGGTLMNNILKLGFDRPRPDLVPHGVEVYSASFPSGHATMAAITYLTLAALLARVQPRLRLRVFLFSLAIFIVVAVGISRVYLGVHWPSDVAAGWAIGSVWAFASWLVADLLRGRSEPEGASGAEAADSPKSDDPSPRR